MEAVFSFKLSELNDEALKKIKDFVGDENAFVTITVSEETNLRFNETKDEFIKRIQSRIDEYHVLHKYPEDLSSMSIVNEPDA
ncbi:MAG TPA: hypothetical protein VH396_11445 [Chitinophagaceae bacterium]|jgi:hypothetical protein